MKTLKSLYCTFFKISYWSSAEVPAGKTKKRAMVLVKGTKLKSKKTFSATFHTLLVSFLCCWLNGCCSLLTPCHCFEFWFLCYSLKNARLAIILQDFEKEQMDFFLLYSFSYLSKNNKMMRLLA